MPRLKTLFRFVVVLPFLFPLLAQAASWNGWSMQRFTAETPHFRIYYHKGIEHLVKPVGNKLEELYGIYSDTYHFKMPEKTQILLQDGDEANGLTFANLNFIILWTHDFDFDLRGSHAWFDDVITHEFAHQASIWIALKYPGWMYGIQLGYFTHPNEQKQVNGFTLLPADILPPWFSEGIAQYESSRHGADRWDSHREMILRSLTLSHHLLTWDHMQNFAGKGDDFEKTYNHGFSLVKYITETYGYDKIVAMCRLSAKATKLDFDGVIKEVLGRSGRQLYAEWKSSLEKKYNAQLVNIGKPVAGKKINKRGYENYWPQFSPDGKKLYFLSNNGADYGHKVLFSYRIADTVKNAPRTKPEMNVSGFYNINAKTGKITYCSDKSPKSELSADQGGGTSMDAFTDVLPPEKLPFRLFPKKTEKQVTQKKGIFYTAFSPTGDRIACAKRAYDRFFLAITDTAGKTFQIVYPDSGNHSQNIYFIYSVAWSPDGKTIAFSYFDKEYRTIGLYDTSTHKVTRLADSTCDQRDPFFSNDGKSLYYSSDKTGIYNIYRYDFENAHTSRLTNVVGSAFAPAISPDGGKLAYAGYDSAGFGIYLIDTVKPIGDTAGETIIPRPEAPVKAGQDLFAQAHKPYSKMPRQFLMSPTIIAEELNTKDNNVYSGASAFKAGVMFNLMDPYSWLGQGTEIDGLVLIEPFKLNHLLNLDHGIIDIRHSYDVWLHGSTSILPVTLAFDYMIMGIAGQDWFYNETEQETQNLPYNIKLQNFDFMLSHYLAGSGGAGAYDDQFAFHLFGGVNRYDVKMALGPNYTQVFPYNQATLYRAGGMMTLMGQARDSRSTISPRGMAAKLQYSFQQLYSLKDENSFTYSDGNITENKNGFRYHELMAHLKYGMDAPVYGDLHFDLRGDAIGIVQRDTSAFPSFYYPIALVPGYTFYFRTIKIKYDTLTNTTPDQDPIRVNQVPNDTVLVTGPGVLSGSVSYRFPLSKPLIDKKLWIFYFEKLYGCLNLSGGTGVTSVSQLLKFNRDDWFVSYGAEVRLQAAMFSGIPLDVSLRWDHAWMTDGQQNSLISQGVSPSKVGGDRFALNIGFDFDNWGSVMLPDYHKPPMAGAVKSW